MLPDETLLDGQVHAEGPAREQVQERLTEGLVTWTIHKSYVVFAQDGVAVGVQPHEEVVGRVVREDVPGYLRPGGEYREYA